MLGGPVHKAQGEAVGMRVPFEEIEDEDYTDAHYLGQPFTGTAFELLGGTIVEECDFIEGRLHGMRRAYFSNGHLRWEARYHEGAHDGRATTFFEDGRVESFAEYAAGELLESRAFTRDGVKVEEYLRESDLLREWRDDGSLRKETLFASPNGFARRLVVEERFYDHDGRATVVQRQGDWRIAGRDRDA